MIDRKLAEAERHIARAEEHVAHQEEIVAELDRDGHDTQQARNLLGTFKTMLASHISARDLLAREKAELAKRLES
ncbi:hypothetical protein [Sinorhizobium terangae]|uniref:hypothetical protein n=1 Tax=Sinorhizobium terangae TaxID=110322 RepID=UPI0024B06B11|nr:hypothetical protein [Sinorhizobium terangae]WFU50260.1 hypothetical protein QA637_26160 [Sinorhizobium terangae]